MNSVKATWMSESFHPVPDCSGLTKSVHAYCRFAIMIIAMSDAHSWNHRLLMLMQPSSQRLLVVSYLVSLGRGRLQPARTFRGSEKLGLLRHRQLHREEAIEQPGVEQADGDQHDVGAVALDQVKVLEQRG